MRKVRRTTRQRVSYCGSMSERVAEGERGSGRERSAVRRTEERGVEGEDFEASHWVLISFAITRTV